MKVPRKLTLFIWVLSLMITMIYPSFYKDSVKAKESDFNFKGTWLWNTKLITKSPKEVVQNIKNQRMNEVYLQLNEDINKKNYQNFIDLCSQSSIKVYILIGSPNWISNKNSAQLNHIFSWISDYQKNAKKTQRFSGIKVDLEPQASLMWNVDRKNAICIYQTIISQFYAYTKQQKINLLLDIAFWYNEVNYSNKYGEGNLYEWVLKNDDVTYLMTYRNKSLGSNSIQSISEKPLKIASQLNKKVVLCIDLSISKEGDNISFNGYSMNEIKNEIALLLPFVQTQSSFAGISIHSYEYIFNKVPVTK